MKTMEFTEEELLYLRRAVDVYTNDLREYIKENGSSALDPTVYDGILDKIEDMIDMIDKEKEVIKSSTNNESLPLFFITIISK